MDLIQNDLSKTNVVGKVRRAVLNGREYLVAPLVLIVEGVLNGSKGPLLYEGREFRKDPSIWNHVPLVVYHPVINGQPVSAREPDVLESRAIGLVLRSKILKSGKLAAEGWFDVEKTKKVDERVLNAIKAGQVVELSTGLFVEQEPREGTFKGVPYTAIARNFKPDHVAILPDQVGACSVKDGCGVGVDNQLSHEGVREQLVALLLSQFKQDEPRPFITDVFDKKFVYDIEGKLFEQRYSTQDDDKVSFIGKPKKVVRKVEFVSTNSNREGKVMPLSEQQRTQIVDNLVANCGCWQEGDREVLNGFTDEKLTSLKEHSDKEQQKEVVANAAKKGFTDPGGNTHTWNEEKQEWETKAPTANTNTAVTPAPTTNAEAPKSLDDWMKSAPPEIQSVVRNARAKEKQEKAELIKTITANERNTFKESFLQTKDVPELQAIANLASVPEQQQPKTDPRFKPNYAGAATPPVGNTGGQQQQQQANNQYSDEDYVLPHPSVDYGEAS